MKKISNILEKILDTDFDINIEPVEPPKLKNKSLQEELERVLKYYNAIATCYPAFAKVAADVQNYIDFIQDAEFTHSNATLLAAELADVIKNASRPQSTEFLETTYQYALTQIDHFNKIIPIIVEIDEACDKAAKKLNIKKRYECTPDNRWKWKSIEIYFTKRSRPESAWDVTKFMTAVKNQLDKTRGISVVLDHGDNGMDYLDISFK